MMKQPIFVFGSLMHNFLLCNFLLVLITKYNVVKCADTTVPLRLYGLNYNSRQGPDWDPNKCKNVTQIAADLTVLSHITSRIRILSLTDCDQGDLVLAAIDQEQIDLSLWLGLWTSNVTSVFEGELQKLRSMLSNGQLSNSRIIGLTVGSEAIYRKELTSAQSIAYLGQVKDLLGEFSITDLPVAIVDVDDIYEQYSELFAASDVAFLNSFPFWEQVPIDNAVDFLNTKLADVWNLANANGKSLILGETGWASEGQNIAASEASGENQAKYLQNFFCSYDVEQQHKYFYFTGIDSDWRVGQEMDPTTVEGHFGIFYHNLTLKPHFQDLVFTCPSSDSVQYRFDLSSDGSPIAPPVPVPTTPLGDIPLSSPVADPVSNPVANPVSSPVASPDATSTPLAMSPSDNAPTTGPKSCSNNPKCKKLGLKGKCCPTTAGLFLDCCNSENVPTALATTSPVASQPTAPPESTVTSQTTSPVAAPTASPVIVDATEAPVSEAPVASPISTSKPSLSGKSDVPSVVSIPPSSIPYGSDFPSQSPTDEVAFNTSRSEPPASTIDSVISDALPSSVASILLVFALNGLWLFTYFAHLL